MAHPPHSSMKRGDRLQLWLFLLAVIVVFVGGILVVVMPRQFGLPGFPVATPVAVEATP